MENTKKAVLIIEDDEDQISWAKNQLGDKYELTFAKSQAQFSKVVENKNKFDFVIIDVFIPEVIVGDLPDFDPPEILSQPTSKHVSSRVKYAHMAYLKGKIKGWAIASNYEHHRDQLPKEEGGVLWEKMDVYKLMACKEANENIFIAFDENVRNNSILLDGNVVDVSTMSEDDICERLMRGKQGKMLKPYKRIMEYLDEK